MDFSRLSDDEQIRLLTALASTALAEYGLSDATVELLKYRENAVFAVRAADGTRSVLRIHRPRYRSDDHIRSELAWMQALAADGIATPGVIATKSGEPIAVVDADGLPEPRQCDLLAWVDGRPLGTLEAGVDLEEAGLRNAYRIVGETAARIHEHGRSWPRPSGFARRPWDSEALVGDEPTFGRFWELEGLDDEHRRLLFAARDRVRERLLGFGTSSDRYGLTHGDLVPDNILVDGSEVRVVDFDDCGDTWYAFELTTSVFPLHGSPAFEPARDGYLEGYRSIRPLPQEHLQLMPTFLMARGLSYLGWPVGRPEMQSGRDLSPMLIYMVTDMAQRYLADEL